MTARRRRLILIALVLAGVVVAATFALQAFRENLSYFFSPSEVAAGQAPTNRSFRLGGMVVNGSVSRQPGSLTVDFDVTDYAHTIPVRYTGVLPDLFREGSGVVARGRLGADGRFEAKEVLAKHDENYMPPEVAAALKKGQARSSAPSGAAAPPAPAAGAFPAQADPQTFSPPPPAPVSPASPEQASPPSSAEGASAASAVPAEADR